MRERDVVVAVAIGSVCAPISVVLLYPYGLGSLWPFPVLTLAAGWLLARRGLTLPSRILGTLGLAAASLIGSAALIEGVLYQVEEVLYQLEVSSSWALVEGGYSTT